MDLDHVLLLAIVTPCFLSQAQFPHGDVARAR